jgi:beta-N-acetylglucosaminidase/Glycosyl hydrolase family 20, domain 2
VQNALMSHRSGLLVAVVALLLAGCAVLSGQNADPVPVASVVPDFMPGDLELAVVPTPVEAILEDVLHPVGGAEVVAAPRTHERAEIEVLAILGTGSDARVLLGSRDRNAELHAFLDDTKTDIDWTWLGSEGYQLIVRRHGGRLVIAIAANTRTGVLWGVQTLRQITWRTSERAWVRGGTVRDRPVFADRGSKRPRVWESAFKANFSWQGPPTPEMRARGRTRHAPTIAPGGRLDASKPAIEKTVEFFREWSLRGSRTFAIRFDDVEFLLDRTGGTDEAYEGDYVKALTEYIRAVRKGISAFDRGARLYWLPQTYHESHPRLETFAREIALAGGLPPDVGLVVTGPRIISRYIPAESVRRMRRLFGLMKTPALIYDNRGRDSDFTPLAGREADLSDEVSGVFGERGTHVNRITRLDWSWNPKAYRPSRSLQLAVRELAGPRAYEPTLNLVRALGSGSQKMSPERSKRLKALFTEVEKAWPAPHWRPDLARDAFLTELRKAVD